MGKYMRKAKTAGEVALMELAQSSLGVRTRAKTLALQRLQKSPAEASSADGSYLQLRSRRLEKPPLPVTGDSKRQKQSPKESCVAKSNPNSRTRLGSVNSGSAESVSDDCWKKEVSRLEAEKVGGEEEENQNNNNVDVGVEVCFGENVLELEGRERSTRESTPCSLIRDPESIRTPGSTTRPTSSPQADTRVQNSLQRNIPTSHEMDKFFASAEEQQQQQFVEKYNFDPVNDEPLPGRYDWVKLDP
ncbi:cyclin-dependent kinase inhibitor 4-like [Camellia sinensis]|uniref:cyclin-dependent kinase inhibitor 4-like n=1 Tax=Camellia sinensis TaxID=4442 RepID=UPI001036310B|nr:cyclin-dependent kinase inhibitor 4-like [Camellia sinensis]